MATYSFLDVTSSIFGLGGSINLAAGAAAAEEGITITPTSEKNIMTIGADGNGMHSLVASEASNVVVKLLKTSPVNAQLQTMYNLQTKSSLGHGSNTITTRNPVSGDSIVLMQVAFNSRPAITYAKEGGFNEWKFDAIKTVQILGSGTPEI